MSETTDIVVIAADTDRPQVEALAFWVTAAEASNTPELVTRIGTLLSLVGDGEKWGGYKVPDITMWGGTLNHLNLGFFLNHIGQIEWHDRRRLQVLVQPEDYSTFAVYMAEAELGPLERVLESRD